MQGVFKDVYVRLWNSKVFQGPWQNFQNSRSFHVEVGEPCFPIVLDST